MSTNLIWPKISVAPMMDWTDRHCRYFHRVLTQHTLLYTEMVTTGALLHGDHERFLKYHSSEHPIALQLGGANPSALARCAIMAEDYGYDEVNLNVGCPSDRVQSGKFGLVLMKSPELVADCFNAMQSVVNIPVTIKTRIGVDEFDSFEFLDKFIEILNNAGVKQICIHARHGWLKGLSPKENREIPPLQYDHVYQIKQRYPELNIAINGGIQTIEHIQMHLEKIDSVMLGRAAYTNPYLLAQVNQTIFGDNKPIATRAEIVEKMLPYIEYELTQGTKLNHITRHILGLFQGQPHGKQWRRYLSTEAYKAGTGVEVVERALEITRADTGIRPYMA